MAYVAPLAPAEAGGACGPLAEAKFVDYAAAVVHAPRRAGDAVRGREGRLRESRGVGVDHDGGKPLSWAPAVRGFCTVETVAPRSRSEPHHR